MGKQTHLLSWPELHEKILLAKYQTAARRRQLNIKIESTEAVNLVLKKSIDCSSKPLLKSSL